jgi:hypothetical protein
MAIIAKSYYITHIKNLIINASSWRRPFDDLYDELNGGLDSANLAPGFNFPGSQVSFSSTLTNYSATQVTAHLRELMPDGYNDLHFFAFGNYLKIFPGVIEIDGEYAYRDTSIVINISDIKAYDSAGSTTEAIQSNSIYSISLIAGEITASNINLHRNLINLDETVFGYNNLGVYTTSTPDTGRRRLVYSIATDACSTVSDHEYFTPPISEHNYLIKESEALADRRFVTDFASAGQNVGGKISSVLRIFNMDTWRYHFYVTGMLSAGTGNQHFYNYTNLNWFNHRYPRRSYMRTLTKSAHGYRHVQVTAATFDVAILTKPSATVIRNLKASNGTANFGFLQIEFADEPNYNKVTDG